MRRLVSTGGILALLLIVVGVAGTVHEAAAAKPRFVDNGNGTITDKQTGLIWEKKTPTGDPTGVNNNYTWSSTFGGTAPDGTLFTDFLAKMNCEISSDGTCGLALAGFTDWRIPTIAELRSILDTSVAGCAGAGGTVACIDPIFGPTASSGYWSSTSDASDPAAAWVVNFDGVVDVSGSNKGNHFFVRAVRGGP